MNIDNKIPEHLTEQHAPIECGDEGCFKVSYQYADISVPVEIKPTATVGDIEVECCGDSIITRKEKCGNSCEIIISQKICIKIPVSYNVSAKVGESAVNCKSNCCQ